MFPEDEHLFMVQSFKNVKDAIIKQGSGFLDFLPSLDQIQTDIYEVQGQSTNNFQLTLPSPDADLTRDLFKGTYQFGFTQISEQYNEAQLKNQLVDHIRQFLLELGRGFSFVGQEYHIKAAGKEKYIDLLFYIIPLHRYCVIEVKITEFDFPNAGQLAGYMGMVDDVLTGDAPPLHRPSHLPQEEKPLRQIRPRQTQRPHRSSRIPTTAPVPPTRAPVEAPNRRRNRASPRKPRLSG